MKYGLLLTVAGCTDCEYMYYCQCLNGSYILLYDDAYIMYFMLAIYTDDTPYFSCTL